jgi:hypothetical protein
MATMKINKTAYLARCKEALAKFEKLEKEYKTEKENYKKAFQDWATEVVEKKQFTHVEEWHYNKLIIVPNDKMTAKQPKEPNRTSLTFGQEQDIKMLKEVITLLEMTDGETIGISVANKVSHLL